MGTADLPITASCVEGEEAFHRLRPEWDALAERIACTTPFLRFKWNATWWKHWGGGHQLRIILLKEGDGRLVGIAPFYISTNPWFKLRARRVGLLADMHTGSDYLGPLVQSGYEQRAGRAIADVLLDTRQEWDYLELDHTLEDHAVLRELRVALCESGYCDRLVKRSTCPYAALPESFEGYFRSLARNLRYNFRRRLKALHREGSVALVVLRNGPEIQSRLQDLIELHRRRFATQGKSSSFLLPDVQQFHRELIGAMGPDDGLRLYILEIRGQAAAALYGFSQGKRFLFFQSGMDPQWSRLSIGLVLMGSVIEQVIKDGHTEFDFLRGDEAYKFQWATAVRSTYTVRMFNRQMKARWVHAFLWLHHKAGSLRRSLVGEGLDHRAIPGEIRRSPRPVPPSTSSPR